MNDRHLLPGDVGWPEDKALMADLNHLKPEITRYIVRYLDADAGRVEPISTRDEDDLGQRLIDLGERVQSRATRRGLQANRRRRCHGQAEAVQAGALEPGAGCGDVVVDGQHPAGSAAMTGMSGDPLDEEGETS